MRNFAIFVVFSLLIYSVASKKFKDGDKPEWAKKDIRDYTDVDMERLLDQWDEDEEPLPEDELPEHLRTPPKVDFSQLDPNNPEAMLQSTKKGRTLMTFVQVSGDLTRDESEDVTKIWQTSLWNSHIQAERYMVDDNRAIFLFKDGSQAWTAKEYLIEQEKCESVTIENKVYPGKYSNSAKDEL